MAKSLAHVIGEQIGFLLEETIVDFISSTVSSDEYYVDYRHPRPARQGAKEVVMVDAQGNKHKLDVVVERGGSENQFGAPVAFIEVAWRRYVKHSKNKVQEISGAILPLVNRYREYVPFQGAVLAGEFTNNSRRQLESEGFSVLYIPYDSICSVFKDSVGIEIEWEEDSTEASLSRLAQRLVRLTERERASVKSLLLERECTLFSTFVGELNNVLSRRVISVSVAPLHGRVTVHESVQMAVRFLQDYDECAMMSIPLVRYQISIQYNTGDSVALSFGDKMSAIRALNQFV